MRTFLRGETVGDCSGVGEGVADSNGVTEGRGDSSGVAAGEGVGESCPRATEDTAAMKNANATLAVM